MMQVGRKARNRTQGRGYSDAQGRATTCCDCDVLRLTAAYCDVLRHTAAQYAALLRTAIYCDVLR
eukprot:2238338-Alexandrium_andersonii.AAC.1